MNEKDAVKTIMASARNTSAKNERIAELEAEVERLRKAQYLPGTPHSDLQGCPMWYDQCLCTVGGLQYNIERADKAEDENELLRAIEQIGRARISKDITRPDVYRAVGQDTNHRLCLALIALDDWRAALAPQGDSGEG